jgi:hypothetical protein
MWVSKSDTVQHLAAWRFAGINYSVHAGRQAPLADRLVVLAVAEDGEYRSVVVAADLASTEIQDMLDAETAEARTRAAERLLGLEDLVLH